MLGIDRTILGFPPFRTPPTMTDAVLDGPIQTRTISTCLTTGDDLQRLQVHCFSFNPEVTARV
jgi:hypothetical protein